jgi:TolB-like protein
VAEAPEIRTTIRGLLPNIPKNTSDINKLGRIATGAISAQMLRPEAGRKRAKLRYALEGSVQRSGNRLRVNVQLIDAETGAHLWAERFDKAVGDLFDMQDEIVARLANQLGGDAGAGHQSFKK